MPFRSKVRTVAAVASLAATFGFLSSTSAHAADPTKPPGGNFDLGIWQLQEPVGAPELDATGTPPETIHLGGESPTETPLIEDHSQPTENADFEPPRVLRRMVE